MTFPKTSDTLSSEAAMNPAVSLLEGRGLLLAALLLIVANLLTLLSSWFDVAGVLVLGVLIPGTLGAAWLLRRALPPMSEFIAYSLGLGLLLFMLVLMTLSVLPGGLRGWHVLVGFNVLNLALGVGWWRAKQRTEVIALPDTALRGWALAGLVSVLLVAGLLRLPDLGYSDFQGDEARAMLRAADILQGYPSALTIHKKGPGEILLPTGIYAVQGTITEAHARFPFALASILGVFAIYLLGWRMFGAAAGWIAAMLLAVDGYLIGFARIVQYQSIVFCMSVLVILALYRLSRTASTGLPSLSAYILLAGLFLVGGAYGHYEAAWVVVPGLYLLAISLYRTPDKQGLLRGMIVPLLVTVGLLLVFYIPLMLDVQWQRTVEDVFEDRIGNSFPYNNLVDIFERSTMYDSTYQFIFMVIMAVLAQVAVLQRIWPRWRVGIVAALTIAGLAVTFFVRPDWLYIGTTDHTWLFFALAVAVAILPPRISHEARTVWLWFSLAMVGSIFFVDSPNTHVYGFFIAWALVAGIAGEAIWQGLRGSIGLPAARWVALPVTVALFAIFGIYTFSLFTYNGVEVFRTWATNRPWGYWTSYELPPRGSIFGFPHKNGWKVVGALYADGTLDAPFETSATYRINHWYSRGLHFCPPDSEYYMMPTTLRPDVAREDPGILAGLEAVGYHKWGVVTVEGDERLQIFSKQPVDEVRVFKETDYAPYFNSTLVQPYFLKPGPAIISQPATPVEYRLKDHLWLKGYTASHTQIAPGERLDLQLYWEVTQMLNVEDKTFVQLIDLETLHKAAQRDSEPGCGEDVYPMPLWRPGELTIDPYSIEIKPDTPPGIYTLLVGVYTAENHERYSVFAADGSHLGDAITLATVEVVAP